MAYMNQYKARDYHWKNVLYPEEGIALMMTLWILVLLIAIASEFTYSTRTEINATKNFKEDIESYYLAKAGINMAIAEILQDTNFHSIDEEKEITFGRPNLPESISSENRKNIELGNGSFSYSIKDDNGKLNLNIIPRETIVKILKLSGMGTGSLRDTIADSILDWRDKDQLHRFNGAEDDYYLTLSPPYESKDAYFDTVEELLWVKGMDKEILYGTDDSQKEEDSEENLLGIYDILTVENIEFVNPNTADRRVLEVLYPPEEAEAIVTARNDNGKYDNSKSSHFVVESTGFLDNSATKRIIKVRLEVIGQGNELFMITKHWNDNKIR